MAPDLQTFIAGVNKEYDAVHRAFEDQFWGTKMALGEPYTTAALSQTKGAMEAFLRDPARLAEAEEWLAKGEGTAEQRKCLQIFVRTFKCYQMSDAEAVALRDQCTAVEDALSAARNHMRLGYEAPGGGGFVERSSVQLRTAMRTNDDEAVRKAAWEGLRSIGPFVLDNGLCEMVRLRNEMARRLGYEDFCVCPCACPLRDVPPPHPQRTTPPTRLRKFLHCFMRVSCCPLAAFDRVAYSLMCIRLLIRPALLVSPCISISR